MCIFGVHREHLTLPYTMHIYMSSSKKSDHMRPIFLKVCELHLNTTLMQTSLYLSGNDGKARN